MRDSIQRVDLTHKKAHLFFLLAAVKTYEAMAGNVTGFYSTSNGTTGDPSLEAINATDTNISPEITVGVWGALAAVVPVGVIVWGCTCAIKKCKGRKVGQQEEGTRLTGGDQLRLFYGSKEENKRWDENGIKEPPNGRRRDGGEARLQV